MTADQEWKHEVWRRWLRIIRRKQHANISADIIVRNSEQKGFSEGVDRIDRRRNQPTFAQKLLS